MTKYKAQLRSDVKYDLRASIYYCIEETIKHNPIYQSCLNCINFNEQKELCNLYNQRPPARIIAYSCPMWEDKETVPF